jgi:hypothetical protein
MSKVQPPELKKLMDKKLSGTSLRSMEGKQGGESD